MFRLQALTFFLSIIQFISPFAVAGESRQLAIGSNNADAKFCTATFKEKGRYESFEDPPSVDKDETSKDAENIALMNSGNDLFAPPDLIERYTKELTSIRSKYPQMNNVRAVTPWSPGVLMIGLTDAALQDHKAGTYTGIDVLNEKYGPVRVKLYMDGATQTLKFEKNYNPQALAEIYQNATGVEYAEASYRIGGGDGIAVDGQVYTFSIGWADCPAGCICSHVWKYEVNQERSAVFLIAGDTSFSMKLGISAALVLSFILSCIHML